LLKAGKKKPAEKEPFLAKTFTWTISDHKKSQERKEPTVFTYKKKTS